MSSSVNRLHLRQLVDAVYDIQKLRIATGNRVVASARLLYESDILQRPQAKEEEDAKNTKVLKIIMSDYKRITDVYVEKFQGKGNVEKAIKASETSSYIRTRIDYELVQQYNSLLDAEEGMVKIVAREVKQHPMWDAFFAEVRGCGPLMAAVCIAYFDPYKARHCSSFWRYAGLDVQRDKNGNMRGVGKWYTEQREYTDSDGSIKERKSLTYNPFLKSKLLGVLGSAFLRAGGGKYNQCYYDYRHRMEQREELSALQCHKRSIRYAVKIFLQDMWVAWRGLECLPITQPYAVDKLGHKEHGDPNIA